MENISWLDWIIYGLVLAMWFTGYPKFELNAAFVALYFLTRILNTLLGIRKDLNDNKNLCH